MKKNILFIDPPGAYSKIVNTGLGYIASCLKKDPDINFKVLDLNSFGINYDDILRDIFGNQRIDGIGVSINVGSMHAIPALLKKLKSYFPDTKIFIGGSHVYLDYKYLLEKFAEFVDCAVLGETENNILEIIDSLDNKDKLSEIASVVLKEDLNKQIVPDRIENINRISFPDYECFESVRLNNCAMDYYPIITSRGCPYSCIFCAGPKISGKKWRFRNPENVVEEIELSFKKYKTRNLEIFDDNFLLDKERAMKIMELILKRNIKMRLRFGNGVRADKLDDEIVGVMKRVGLYEVGIGIESADPEIFRSIKKGEDFEKIEKAIKLLKKYDINLGGSFIIGLPNATLEKDIESIKFVNRIRLNWRYIAWCYFTPYHYTEAYDMIKNDVSAYIIEKSYKRGHFTANYIETKNYPLEDRIIARSIASRIPPVHPDYSKLKLFKLFLKMEYVVFKNRDADLSFFRFNIEMLNKLFIYFKRVLNNEVPENAYF